MPIDPEDIPEVLELVIETLNELQAAQRHLILAFVELAEATQGEVKSLDIRRAADRIRRDMEE